MKLAIIGQGAIGSLFSYYWRAVNPSILVRHLPTSPKQLHLLNDTACITIDNPMFAVNDTGNQAFDTIIISVKCYQVAALIEHLRTWLQPNTVLVLIQNGMGGAELLQQAFPNNPLVVGTSTDGVFRIDAHAYQHTAQGQLDIGFYCTEHEQCAQNLPSTEWLEAFCQYHPGANIQANIQLALYRKLAVNALINPLTASLNVKNGELVNYPKQVSQLKADIFAIFDSMNVDWRLLKFNQTIDSVIQTTANNYSSMQQDLQYQRKTEIDGVLGYLLAQGTKKGVNTPFLKSLYDTIKQLESL